MISQTVLVYSIFLLELIRQRNEEIEKIIFTVKKIATIPTRIADVIAAGTKLVAANAKLLDIIAPTILAIK